VHPDGQEAIRRGEDAFKFFSYSLGYVAMYGQHKPGRSAMWQRFLEVKDEMQSNPGHGGIGSPEEVRVNFERYERIGMDQIIFIQQCGRAQHAHICESLELFVREVMPAFKARDAVREREKREELAPYLRAALERKQRLRPLSDAEIPVVESFGRKQRTDVGIARADTMSDRGGAVNVPLQDPHVSSDSISTTACWLRSGCTTQVEMALSLRQAQSYVRVARKWGVRGYPGGMIPGIARLFPIWFRRDDKALTDSVPGTLKEIADNLAFAKQVRANGDGRLVPMMSPHATDTHTPETMAALLAAARELGSGLHIHLSQSQRETDTVKRLWGATPTQWLEQLGFFAAPVFAAHLTGMDLATDLEIIKKHGAIYSHCPRRAGLAAAAACSPILRRWRWACR
jgi:hypothetical protein